MCKQIGGPGFPLNLIYKNTGDAVWQLLSWRSILICYAQAWGKAREETAKNQTWGIPPTQSVRGWAITHGLESPGPEARVWTLVRLVVGLWASEPPLPCRTLYLREPWGSGCSPPNDYERQLRTHGQFHQNRGVPAAQQLIWENDFSDLYTMVLGSDMSYHQGLLQKGLGTRVWAPISCRHGWGRA